MGGQTVIRIAINGFGRMGRLALRQGWDDPALEFTHVNDPAMSPQIAAHLLEFDSVHGRFSRAVEHDDEAIHVDGRRIVFTRHAELDATTAAIGNTDVALECSGRYRDATLLEPWLAAAAHVVVSAPVTGDAPNVVVGVNDTDFDPQRHRILSAASCTTNCLAPIVKVVHQRFGIRHGSITTIHDVTNTQNVIDAAHKDLRRARAAGLSLIPTTTGSARAITRIFPELEGRLNGHAVRVPLLNASLTDAVFELRRSVDRDEANRALRNAANGELRGILGFEDRPLVSADYRGDPRSAIVDGPATMVVGGTQLKVYAWYDNEIGYVCRMLDLVRRCAESAS
jgi:glyceraldehyde 3-phosphate dehydrogenase